jgi:glycosyltransferase involved in cell wall biosynthesis
VNNILVITYWSFSDALIQTYTYPYLGIIARYLPAGSTIYLLTLEKDHSVLKGDKRSAIESKLPPNIIWLPFAYHPFGMRAAIAWLFILAKLVGLIINKKISTIHPWATPAGAIGYVLSVITGRKLVVDSYEPHAEAMVENGTWKRDSIAFRLLFLLERLQTKRARYVISATEGMRSYAKQKYNVDLINFKVKPACVDLTLFSKGNLKKDDLLQSLGLDNKIVCVYAGKFGGIYFDREVFDLFKHAHEHWGERFRVLLLTSHSTEEVDRFCDQSGLDRNIVFTRFVAHASIPDYIGAADFAVTPVKPVPTKRYCTPIKDGEYWALGLPVIISRDISDDSDIIHNNNIGAVIPDYNPENFRKAFTIIDQLLSESTDTRFARIRAIAEKYRNFSVAHDAYKSIYSDDFG